MLGKLYVSPIAAAAMYAFLAGCSASRPVAAASAGAPPEADSAPSAPVTRRSPADSFPWLVADATARTVTLNLEVTAPVGAPSAVINGYRSGQVRIIVPVGWTVRW